MHKHWLWIGIFTLVACGDEGTHFRSAVNPVGPPVALGEQLVFVRSHDRSALFVSPQAFDDGDVKRVQLPVGPLAPVLRNGDGTPEALVLCEGRRGDRKHEAVAATLAVLDADGNQRRYALGNPFQAIQQSVDGRYAILLKSANSGRLLDNPLEIAIVDLDKDGEDGVTLRTLRSFGDAPTRVHFSPELTIGGESRRLAVAFSASDVTLIDLEHLDRAETTVPLSSSTSRDVVPEQVVFDAERGTLYVRGGASNDLFVMQLEAQPNDPGRNDFKPFLNLLPTGQGPRDMALFDAGDGPRLLVVAETSQQAVIVQAGSSQTTSIPLATPADHVLLFEATSPSDAERARRALLYDQGGTGLMFLDLDDVEQQRTRNLETLSLDHAISGVVPLLDDGLVLVLHDAAAVSLVDLADRTVTPIRAAQSLANAHFDAEHKRLWVAPQHQPWVGFLDLGTGETRELLLDAPVEAFVPLPDAGKFAVVHPSALGSLTVFDATEPERDTAQGLRGFLVDGFVEVE